MNTEEKINLVESNVGIATPSDLANVKVNAVGYDPMGDGDICSCGGRIIWSPEAAEPGSAATMVGRCQKCGKTPDQV